MCNSPTIFKLIIAGRTESSLLYGCWKYCKHRAVSRDLFLQYRMCGGSLLRVFIGAADGGAYDRSLSYVSLDLQNLYFLVTILHIRDVAIL